MRYPSLRKSAISHRLILTFAVVLVLGIAGSAAVLSATTITPAKEGPYTLNYSMNKNEQGQLAIRVRVVDTRTQEVIGENAATVEPGRSLTMRFGQSNDDNDRECLVTSRTNSDGSGTLTLTVTRNSVEEQRSNYDFPAPGVATATATRTYTGDPISMDLASADLRDVLKTFGQLTGMTIDIAPDVKGTVNVHFRGTPWDQALDQILTENGCAYRIEGSTMHVFRATP